MKIIQFSSQQKIKIFRELGTRKSRKVLKTSGKLKNRKIENTNNA